MLGDLSRRTWPLAVLLLFAATGCDPGTDNGLPGDPNSADSQSLEPYKNELNTDEAYHLLRRAAFGATPDQVAATVERGLFATVDDLLTIRQTPNAVKYLARAYEDNIPKRWMVHLMEGPNPLRERLALFWHDRFATSRRVLGGGDGKAAIDHMEMLRGSALANYRDFLKALTIDPLMLVWLNGAESPKDSPNENYAREFWELFTLGRDVLYTESDIREAARAFTGTTLIRDQNGLRPIFDLQNHDNTSKNIFPSRAEPQNYDYESVIELTLAQPEAARYVARNLFILFIHDHPSDATVQDLANSFTDSDFEIAPLVRRLLTSKAFFSAAAYGNQVESPVEHYVGLARTLDMHMYSEDSQGYFLDCTTQALAEGGQELLNPPGVEGWKEDLGWMTDQWVLNRVNALERPMDFGPDRTPELPYHLLPPTSEWSQREVRPKIVDNMAKVFHLPLTDAERDIYIEVLDQGGYLAFNLTDPDDQPRHVLELIRLMAMDERVICR